MTKPYLFKEQEHYSFQYLKDLIKNKEILRELKDLDIVKSEGSDYKFEFVGVIIIQDKVICCYPKYFPEKNEIDDDFKQIVKVVKRFNKKRDSSLYQDDEFDESPYNLLSLMLFFIEDYYENGIYTKTQEILEINGNGEIDWNRTINETFPIIQNGKPYYIELKTRYKLNDLVNYFRLLHECIITECSQTLESYELLDLFGLNSLELSDKSLKDFGDNEFIKERLLKELNIEFNTHKRKLLKAMYSYICKDNTTREDFLTLYGSNSYYDIWEDMCSEVLVNSLDKTLDDLFKDKLEKKEWIDVKLKNIIDIPCIHLDGKKIPSSRLEPDIVFINKKRDELIILDPKYRNLSQDTVDDRLSLYDINKQYLYHLAYCELIKSQKIKKIKNALLFPSYDDNVKWRGFIESPMFLDIKLKNIQLISLPARKINQLYLEGKTKPISCLKLKDM